MANNFASSFLISDVLIYDVFLVSEQYIVCMYKLKFLHMCPAVLKLKVDSKLLDVESRLAKLKSHDRGA